MFGSEPSGFAILGNAGEAVELSRRVVTGIEQRDKVFSMGAAQDGDRFFAQRAAQQC
jgi:hypothetical protein